MRLIDTHCHLDVGEFDRDRDAVIARAEASGVVAQVVPAIDRAGWPGLRDICGSHAGLHAAYGLHPMFLPAHRPEDLGELEAWIERETPVAVGECGLDYFVDGLDRDDQHRYFEAQLAIARACELPVVIHARRAVEAVIVALRKVPGVRGVVHSFPGSPEQARQLWGLGIHIGMGGPVTYSRANRLRDVARTIPLEQLLLETDAPDQPLSTHRGLRNEPSRLPEVCETIAGLRGMTCDELATATTRNATGLFKLPPTQST